MTQSHSGKYSPAGQVNRGCKNCPFAFEILSSDNRTVSSVMNDAGDVRRCLTRKEDNPGELGQRLGDATAAWGRPANRLLF